jgi:hypothetical protein
MLGPAQNADRLSFIALLRLARILHLRSTQAVRTFSGHFGLGLPKSLSCRLANTCRHESYQPRRQRKRHSLRNLALSIPDPGL